MRRWMIVRGPDPLPAGTCGWEWELRRGRRRRRLRVVLDRRVWDPSLVDGPLPSVPTGVADLVATQLDSRRPPSEIHLTTDALAPGPLASLRFTELTRAEMARSRVTDRVPAWLTRSRRRERDAL